LFREYQKLKEEHKEKLKEVETIVFRKTMEKREAEERMSQNSFESRLHQ